jgi:hypothetical protein
MQRGIDAMVSAYMAMSGVLVSIHQHDMDLQVDKHPGTMWYYKYKNASRCNLSPSDSHL